MRQTNYTRFKNALEEQKTLNFVKLKKDIDSIKCFIEKTLDMALESTQTTVERDYKVSSL